MKFEIDIDDTKIKKAIEKGGKLDAYQIEFAARQVIETKVKAHMRKKLDVTALHKVVDDVWDNLDWNDIIKTKLAQMCERDNY